VWWSDGHERALWLRNQGKIGPGGVFLCWVTKTSACVGALTVTSPAYEVLDEDPPTWLKALYPLRFKTELRLRVPITQGISLQQIREHTTDQVLWRWVFRNSGNEIPQTDAEWIVAKLEQTEPKLGPDDDEPEIPLELEAQPGETDSDHPRIQRKLVQLGLDMGLDVWVARNDRGGAFVDSRTFGDVSVDHLPAGLPEAGRRTVDLIDVVWLRRGWYAAAFEIESTTRIYTGLLRMGDLVALMPTVGIPLFIVATESRRGKVFEELTRIARAPFDSSCTLRRISACSSSEGTGTGKRLTSATLARGAVSPMSRSSTRASISGELRTFIKYSESSSALALISIIL
jgi:hypothetical protein